jgi:ABC-type nitrate/sulfonate/bicarbonate transport system permease component
METPDRRRMRSKASNLVNRDESSPMTGETAVRGCPRQVRPSSSMRAIIRFYLDREQIVLGTCAVVIFLLFWEGLTRGWWAQLLEPVFGHAASGLKIRPIFISSPSRVASEAFQMFFVTGEIWGDLRVSGLEYLSGFLLAVVIGVPLGLAAGWYRKIYDVVEPFVSGLNAAPQIAFLPLFIVWFGLGLGSKVAIIFLFSVLPLIRSAIAGVKQTDLRFLRMADSFCCSKWRLFYTIILPSAVPLLLSGLRLSIGQAMIGIVVGEIYGSQEGVGVMINVASSRFQTDKVFVGVFVIAVVGLFLSHLVRHIESRVEVWRPKK